MKAVVRGPLLSMSGYGNHAREVYRWLEEKEGVDIVTQILPWGVTPWHVNPDALGGMVNRIMRKSVPLNTSQNIDISFQVQLPNEWDPNLAKFNVGVTAAVESNLCSKAWVMACNTMNLVVVPSNHTKTTLENSGNISTPIVVVPEAFVDEISSDDVSPLELNVRTDFNFLMFGQLTGGNAFVDRKNTFFTLRWLMEEFNGTPDVGIILKTNNGRNTTIDRKSCRSMIKRIKHEIKSDVPIYLLHGSLTGKEVAGLYRNQSVKALVSATRGEGFGLPLLEAAASALPVLATNWSAHCEFLNAGKWIKFDYDLVNIPNARVDNSIFIEGSKWAEVKEDDFKAKVRKFHKSSAKPKEWAAELSSRILENYSFENISSAWDQVAKEHFGW